MVLSGMLSMEKFGHVRLLPSQHGMIVPAVGVLGVRALVDAAVIIVEDTSAAPTTRMDEDFCFRADRLLIALLEEAAERGEASGTLWSHLQERLAALEPIGGALPVPGDPRGRKVALGILGDPADQATLEDWGNRVGACRRTLQRIFEAETGLTFRDYRRRARIHHAMAMLAKGESVGAVALAAGYENAAGFITAFRGVAGMTPGQYAASAREGRPTLRPLFGSSWP